MFAFTFYVKYFLIFTIILAIMLKFIFKKFNYVKFFVFCLMLLYCLNVVVIGLWKFPEFQMCLNTSIFYRPLFSKMHLIPGNVFVDFYHSFINTNNFWHASKFIFFFILNIAYFIPFSILLKKLTSLSDLSILTMGLLFSCFIEFLQISGIFGFYNCSWRYFDIDDIIANVSGVYIGLKCYILGVKLWKRKR